MEARLVEALPTGKGWQYEPKWDGFRCLAVRDGGKVELIGKSGKSLTRYFPEVVASLSGSAASQFVLDGELAVPIGNGLVFDALQMRLHPARSRIDRLARETPAILIVFDMLQTAEGDDILSEPLSERRRRLEAFFRGRHVPDVLRLSPASRSRAEAVKWLERVGGGALDGVVAKRLDEPYRPGERTMLKVKCLRTADCVVGGFRYATGREGERDRLVGSLLLGLFDEEGRLDHVGFTSGIADSERAALTRKLERLRGAGFTGKAPGGPSRWSTERSGEWEGVKPRLVAEVQYDHVTADRFRHGTRFLRWRPDKSPRQCTFDQLQRPARPSKMMKAVAG
ncbi:MAG: ATP-dependent DNA ligase LigC [Enhydrobacter sp.]|jgi:ATP-dependent DNA ligase|nr:MAG: ATP-dependent DNA ligase LigC [Enhydrobacter sp.]